MSFEQAVKGLGGDDEDIALLKNVDIEGSIMQGTSGKVDRSLSNDVTSMWKELSKGQKAGKSEKKPKTKSKPEKQSAQPPADPKKAGKKIVFDDQATNEKSKKPAKSKEPQHKKSLLSQDNAKPTEKKTKVVATNSDVENRKKGPKQSQIIAEISHPNTIVFLDNDVWSVEAHGTQPVALDLVDTLKDKAYELLYKENELYQAEQSKSSEYNQQIEFLKSGTFSDQLGTLSILITDSPMHYLKQLQTLLGKCEVKNRESASKALEVMKDLLVSHVLPDRRLKAFKEQDLTLDAGPASLIAWAYEDWLKNFFFKLLQMMERLLSDSVEQIRMRVLYAIFGFFESKPEQELNLLRLALNKLGDPSGKVASKVKKLLMDVFVVHPNMKPVVASVISETIDRSPDYNTRYYAIDTLSEFILSAKYPDLANQLIYIYLNLFERLLREWETKSDTREEKAGKERRRNKKRGKKGGLVQEAKAVSQVEEEQNARLVAKIFTGLNRAFPFSQIEPSAFNKYMNTLYKMSHSPNCSTYIEALSFIFQLAKAQQGQGLDRYFKALYASLLDPRLYQASKISKYLHLLLKSVAMDTCTERSMAFAKRVCQTACQWPEIGAVASLVHILNFIPGSTELLSSAPREEEYEMKNQEPKFAKAQTSKLWELIPLLNHYHPTVTLYAQNLLNEPKQSLDMPDIEQYTVNSFLYKWSYKKPRERENMRGGSMFQPLSGYTDLNLGIRTEQKNSAVPISVQDWSKRTANNVAPDERFYLEYFKAKPKKEKKKKVDNDDEDSEDEVFDAIMRANPDEMPSDDDNLGFSDLDDDEMDELKAMSGGSSDENESSSDADEFADEFGEESDLDLDGQDAIEGSNDSVDSADDDEETGKKSKRKREWMSLPAFMDADEFAALNAEKEKAKPKPKRPKNRSRK